MSETRQMILGGALTAPFLTYFTSRPSGTPQHHNWGTVANGWVEIRWTPAAQALFDQFQATIAVIAPVELFNDEGGAGVRFPVRSGTDDPSRANSPQAQDNGLLDGGLVLRTPTGEVRVSELRPVLRDELVSGTCTVNGFQVSVQPMLHCSLEEGRLVAEPAPLGQPLTVRLTGVPARPTREAVDAFAPALGTTTLSPDTVLAHVTAEAEYTPPRY